MATLTPNRDAEVTIVEQGNLTIEKSTTTYGGTGTFQTFIEVPAGKKYRIKMAKEYHSGTATKTSSVFKIFDVGQSSNVTVTTLTAGGVDLELYGEQGLVLPAGWRFSLQDAVSANTNGSAELTLMYEDLDA